ncbi:helix-turn-helix transcriptional regulator [Sphingomonas sp. Leaf257]|jgi:hypothetical protein|uniref:helix-turn-helix transcriptional regulator n=1 Tax=Sphingomonas sp. Leaf257 TaxID=1736309 RepID=UPI0009EB10C3|nr:DNA-binding protein [Sphingomonas sp. Leaf257]
MEMVKVKITPDGRLTRHDAAAFLGLSVKTLANRNGRGLPPHSFRVGGKRFYWLKELQAFIDGQDLEPKLAGL